MPAFIDNQALQSLFDLPAPDGHFEGATLEYFRALGRRRPLLLLAFAPKAAGTFFREAAVIALKGQLIRAVQAQGGRDAVPYLPQFVAAYLSPDDPAMIAHVHMQALPANRNFMAAFGIRPVIMLRNIADMLSSYWDMLEADPVARADGLNCLIPADFTAMSREQKADFMIDVVAPWYASYFATWKNVCDEEPAVVKVLRYEDLRAKPAETLHLAISHAGFSVTRRVCEAAVTAAWEKRDLLRFNKGVGRRGESYFSAEHGARLARMLSHYRQLAPWRDALLES